MIFIILFSQLIGIISELSVQTKQDLEILIPWGPGLEEVLEYKINLEQRKVNRLVHQEQVVVLALEGSLFYKDILYIHMF